jgi:hypothetical protein
VEALREEILLCIMEKFPFRVTNEQTRPNYSSNFLSTCQKDHKALERLVQEISKMNRNGDEIKDLKEQLDKMQEQSRELEKQLNNSQQSSVQAESTQKESQILKESQKFNLLILFLLGLIIGGICGVIGLKNYIWKRKTKKSSKGE